MPPKSLRFIIIIIISRLESIFCCPYCNDMNMNVCAGEAAAEVILQILPANETRLMHEFTLSLLSVEPSNVVSFKPGFSMKRFIIPDVGNPGGVFSFGPDMNSSYTVRVTTHKIVLHNFFSKLL